MQSCSRLIAAAILFVSHMAAIQADLARVGPVSAFNGYPEWYQDHTGLALNLCLPNATELANGSCLMLPADLPNPAAPISFPDNYADEGFYYAAEVIAPVNGGSAAIIMATEAAFFNGPVVDGDQTVFNRIRIRVDVPPPGGTYTITHPYGVETFTNVAPGLKAINFTDDVGLVKQDFSAALTGRLGPFLRAASFPGGPALDPVVIAGGNTFLADPAIATSVTGSPFNTNFFRIEGPNIGGPGIDVVEAQQFFLYGKVKTDPIPGIVNVYNASYTRNAGSGMIEVHASASPAIGGATPILSVSGANIESRVMENHGNHYHVQIVPSDPAAIPASVFITNHADASPVPIEKNLTDMVHITLSNWDPDTRILTVQAHTTDELAAANMVVFADGMNVGSLDATGTLSVLAPAPHAGVVVISTNGGRDSASVENGAMPRLGPVAADDIGVTSSDVGLVTIPVLANDSSDALASAITIIGQPANGSVSVNTVTGEITYTANPDFIGSDVFSYVVNDASGDRSNLASVFMAVTAPLNAPVANDDSSLVKVNEAVVISVLANDTDSENNIIASTVSIVAAPAGGSTIANADGTVTFTAGANTGVQTFQYTVSDDTGLTSNVATVTVDVQAATVNNPPVAVDDSASTVVNSATNINVLANDTDTEGDINPASVTIVSVPAEGSAVVNVDGSIDYTAGPNPGSFSFQYQVLDSTLQASNVATVTVEVGAAEVITVTRTDLKLPDEWRISGTSDGIGNTVTVYIGPTVGGTILGQTIVDNLGAWQVRDRSGDFLPDATNTISIMTSGGAIIEAIPLTIN